MKKKLNNIKEVASKVVLTCSAIGRVAVRVSESGRSGVTRVTCYLLHHLTSSQWLTKDTNNERMGIHTP